MIQISHFCVIQIFVFFHAPAQGSRSDLGLPASTGGKRAAAGMTALRPLPGFRGAQGSSLAGGVPSRAHSQLTATPPARAAGRPRAVRPATESVAFRAVYRAGRTAHGLGHLRLGARAVASAGRRPAPSHAGVGGRSAASRPATVHADQDISQP